MSHVTPGRAGHVLPQLAEWVPAEAGCRKTNPHFKLTSSIKRGAAVTFPEFKGERVYMRAFLKTHNEVLLPTLLKRWIPTVSAMLEGIESEEPMYLMIDQGEVEAGKTQRRSGVHIDGNWRTNGGSFDPNEILILASDIQGCVAYLGTYLSNHVGAGGDCSTLDLEKFDYKPLCPNYAYIGTVATIHESIPVKESCNRTLVRINVPNGKRS